MRFSSYDEALTNAMGWFSAITIESSRTTTTTPSHPISPWNVTGLLIDDTGSIARTYANTGISYAGQGTLRPTGKSGRIPTIDLTADKFRGKHNTPGRKGAEEVKFHYPGDDDPNHPIALVCPQIWPNNDRIYDDIIDHHYPTPTPAPGPAPSPVPLPAPANPWRMPQIPPLPIPRRIPFPFSAPRH